MVFFFNSRNTLFLSCFSYGPIRSVFMSGSEWKVTGRLLLCAPAHFSGSGLCKISHTIYFLHIFTVQKLPVSDDSGLLVL